MNDLELKWKNKKARVEKVLLPFQKIESVSISRTGRKTLLAHNVRQQEEEWKNKLIWGDNKYVLASLLNDPTVAGKIKLIYIDPPFFTGTNMNINIKIGDKNAVTKEPSAIEEVAYRNMWKDGPSSFLQYIYERIKIMRDLLSDDGSIFVRFDYHYAHYVKIILDEIFGYKNFRNEIIINRSSRPTEPKGMYHTTHDVLFFYSKTSNYYFKNFEIKRENPQWRPMHLPGIRWTKIDEKYKSLFKKDIKEKNGEFKTRARIFFGKEILPPEGRHWAISQENLLILEKEGKLKLDEKGKPLSLESDTKKIGDNWTDIPGYDKKTGYPTENHEKVLQRVIETSSQRGDIVADFFSGSGTTVAVAEKMGRRWIGADIGKFSIHTIRKRLLDIPECKRFEVFNMGKYERTYWASENLENYRNYVNFVVKLYDGRVLDNFEHVHGKKGSSAIHVGLVDSPITKKEVLDAVTECKKSGFSSLDVLGWEWEMGLNNSILKEVKDEFGVSLSLRLIPREVMDKRAVDAGDIDFYELASLEVEVNQYNKAVNVELRDFIIPNPELIPVEVQSKIKKFGDYVDYWAVDWTYDGVFHNQWQTYRTKDNPNLILKTANHQYAKGGGQFIKF